MVIENITQVNRVKSTEPLLNKFQTHVPIIYTVICTLGHGEFESEMSSLSSVRQILMEES